MEAGGEGGCWDEGDSGTNAMSEIGKCASGGEVGGGSKFLDFREAIGEITLCVLPQSTLYSGS